MDWSGHLNLVIGGIEIPARCFTDGFSQDYEELSGVSGRRMLDGSLLIQQAWPLNGEYKLRTTIQGAGRMVPPLDGVSRADPVEVQCAQHRHKAAAGNVITLPAGRRSGGRYAPKGYALVNGELVETALSLAGDVATLTLVAGAAHYEARYWPKFSGLMTVRLGGEPWLARRSWTVVIEEE